jgi:Fe-S-cluster containining protein
VLSLPVVNRSEATFECIYGRGCDGLCCQSGRPPVYPEEHERIAKNLKKFLPELRPEARRLVEREGFVSNRRKDGQPMLRVLGGWCVFFNKGCVLHKVGAAEGDKYRYKPYLCAIFPLAKSPAGEWYVRQWDYRAEGWDVFCLNPEASAKPAVESLSEEIDLAARVARREARRTKTKKTKSRR